ncbi:MAG: hypothetical protein ICV78_10460 [Tolypothrix sp. Co-bin9]|nr:hypothetical protein [Tolypothrix sp. Co-bin9]
MPSRAKQIKEKPPRLTDPDPTKILPFRKPAGVDVKDVAKRAGMNVNALLRAALFEYMEKNGLNS